MLRSCSRFSGVMVSVEGQLKLVYRPPAWKVTLAQVLANVPELERDVTGLAMIEGIVGRVHLDGVQGIGPRSLYRSQGDLGGGHASACFLDEAGGATP
mgnify:CR=1 FL=1